MQPPTQTFSPKSIELTGEFTLSRAPDLAFELFSPLGEKRWVPGWSPELLFPPGVAWDRGLIFRTLEERGEAVWVVTRLDRGGHEVEYVRVETGRYVARVTVRCAADGANQTRVAVTYLFVGLTNHGNDDIANMTPEHYEEKMRRWQEWIELAMHGK